MQSWSERGGGVGWSEAEPAVVVSGLPAVNPGACGPEGRCSDLSLLRRVAWGAGPAARTPGVLSSHCAPRLRPRPRSPASASECVVTPGEDCQGTLVTRSPWFVRGRSSGVWGPHSLTFSQGAPVLSSVFQLFEYQESQVYAPVRSSLALPRAGSEFPKFSEFTLHPQGQIPSHIHSIIINALSSVLRFKQTQCFNCLSFSSQSLGWLFFPFFCLWLFSTRRKQKITT